MPLPPGEPLDELVREAERQLAHKGSLPWMVIGGTGRERVAVTHAALTPAECAAAERALLRERDVDWVVTVGEAALLANMGVLRHLFLRRSFPDERWEARVRPFMVATELMWLGPWRRQMGSGPEGGALSPIFVEPVDRKVRLLKDVEDVQPNALVEVPEGSLPRDVMLRAGHVIEATFVAKGYVPPCVLRWTGGVLELRLLDRGAPRYKARDLALRLAQDPETKAIGMAGRSRDEQIQPPAEQIRAGLEFRDGPALVWRRRFRVMGENKARWLDPGGEILPADGRRSFLP
jgi:hypothetical protein